MIGIHQRPAVPRGLAQSFWGSRVMMATSLTCLLAGCAIGTSQGPSPRSPEPTASRRPTPSNRQLDPRQAERLKQVMLPLIQHMNKPLPLNQVRVGILEDPQINAANAGGGEFYVTTGLLERASDDQLRGVLAHEVAHADLGHVAKAQALGTGLNIGMILLDQFIPGSSKITPLVADLGVMRPFSRNEEYEADAHGVDILQRAGYNGKQIMSGTLTWLLQTSGPSGGFFATHPGTDDRIQRVHNLP
jgi:Zn-dependent protease with chaperone function